MTAPCGLACWSCAVYKDNITEEVAQHVGGMLGLDASEVPCGGCRSEKGCSFEDPLTGGKGCPTKNCTEKRGLHNCSECDEFPCENLMPVAEIADQVPHNTKVYNLSRIRLLGLEGWAKEASLIQAKYFKGRFVYGEGPALTE